MRSGFFLGVVLTLYAAVLPGAEDETSRLTLQVLREENKKPVANAHVVVKFVTEKILKDKRTSWEAKTNRNGVLVLNDIPTGPIKIQVIASGYQTYGDDYQLTKTEEELTILLKLPQGQFSAYPEAPSP